MLQKFEEAKKRLAPEHHDLMRYAQHLFDEINAYFTKTEWTSKNRS